MKESLMKQGKKAPPSKPVKKEIAGKMKKTPKWKEHDSIHKTFDQSKSYDRVMDNVDHRKWD